MKHTEEYPVILDKIRKLAQENKPFDRYSFFSLYSGQHMSYDWQECLDTLVSQGELIKIGGKYKLREVTMETQTVYKALVRTKDGRLVSIWSDRILDYNEGQITYAPKGSMGIFIRPTLEGAKYSGKTNSRRRCKELGGTRVVHEATPLGNLCSKAGSSIFLADDRYPAILLGKEVWRDKPIRPEPKFKVGDKVVGTCSSSTGEVFTIESIKGDEAWFTKGTWLGIKQIKLASKEEWVDVTKECDLKLSTPYGKEYNLVQVNYQGQQIVELGTGKPWITTDPHYRVEGKAFTHDSFTWFKVLKKVV